MSTATAIRTATGFVDETLWQKYDDAGWEHFFAWQYNVAERYFDKAWKLANQFPEDDYRRGRTVAGIAWVRLRQLRKKQWADTEPCNIDDWFETINQEASAAIQLLDSDDVPQRDLIFRAYALQLRGITEIELCRGHHAECTLATAQAVYASVGHQRNVVKLKHYLAKLKQCRGKYHEAARMFLEVLRQSDDVERRARALLDYANVLMWLGHVRQARQLRAAWQRLEEQFKPPPPPNRLILRACLLFARVAIKFGDLAGADELLCRASQLLCILKDPSPLCWATYRILRAELALEHGCLLQAEDFLSKIVVPVEPPASGFDCLEIIAIDASCPQCVIECCTREVVCCDTCCCRPARRMVFAEEHKNLEPISVFDLIRKLCENIYAAVMFHRNAFRNAEPLHQKVVEDIEVRIGPESPVLTEPLLDFASAIQGQKKNSDQVADVLDRVMRITNSLKAPRHPAVSRVLQLMGNWRFQSSEYDLAASLYEDAIEVQQHSTSSQSVWRGVLLAHLGAATAGMGQYEKASEYLERALGILCPVVPRLDDRVLEASTNLAWVCALAGNLCGAKRAFQRVNQCWKARLKVPEYQVLPEHPQGEHAGAPNAQTQQTDGQPTTEELAEGQQAEGQHSEPSPQDPREYQESRRGSALLGLIVTVLETGSPVCEHECETKCAKCSAKCATVNAEELFAEFLDVVSWQMNEAMIAHELNRVGMLVKGACLYRAAEFLFERAIAMYQRQGRCEFVESVQNNLNRIPDCRSEVQCCQ